MDRILAILPQLTLMSISDEIGEHVTNGDLVPLRPRIGFGARQIRRYMFLTNELNSNIQSEIASGDIRFAELEADLINFLVEPEIEKDYLKQLRPPTDGVWEIRSQRVEPTIRVFGQFAKKNTLIATSFRYRGDLEEFSNPEWDREKKLTQHAYRQLFPCHQAKNTINAYKLFDGAIDEKYYDD